MRTLLLTPPMTQINTPYPATAYLTGFLRERGYDTVQEDPAIEVLLRLLSRNGIEAIGRVLKGSLPAVKRHPSVKHFLAHHREYLASVDAVVRFLQGRDPMLAHRICSDRLLPQGPRFSVLCDYEEGGENEGQDRLSWAFGALGVQDRAQHLASLYIDDLSDVIRVGVDSSFELSRYAEKLAASSPTFDPILEKLEGPPSLVDETLDLVTEELMRKHQPQVVGLTVPFPGNVYGAFRMARKIKSEWPSTRIILGGGYVNTELRKLSDPRVFDYLDFITLDDGERPLLAILESLAKPENSPKYLRTFVRKENQVEWISDSSLHDIPMKDTGTPVYDGLPLDKYLSLCELLNPMHRLWSDGRWNKLTLAHGCYWKKCSFCDISLDYIGRYEQQSADLLVDRIETLVRETGQTGFHFVDEAAPPKVLAALAKRLIERDVVITWWGNIRFEKTFTPELCELLAQSGCVAVSGGLEVASDRLLELMNKGVTVEQVARVTHAFTEAGVMVHAYLMFGFPTQTVEETIDSLERVRQLFAAGCIQSAFWHRFSATAHSPVGLNPERYGITLHDVPYTFAHNDIAFEDATGVDHEALHPGLKKALYNYMHGIGLEEDVRTWFDFPVPKPKVSKRLIVSALHTPAKSSGRQSQ